MRFWDPRFTESVKLINTPFNTLTAMAVHQEANIIAWEAVFRPVSKGGGVLGFRLYLGENIYLIPLVDVVY